MARRHLINVHSSIEGKEPKVAANEMKYGELAVNHFKGKAFISTRVSDTDMELFPSVHYIEQYPFSSLTVNGLTTLSGTTKIEKIEAGDNTFDKVLDSKSTNAVQNKAITQVIEDNEKIVSSSLNDLNERKLDVSAYTPITSDEITKWNNAADKLNTIDTALSATSNNLVVNSAITKAIQDNEEVISASLNDLNKRKLDASAYTPTDLSDYYKKEETSGKTEIAAALNSKANDIDLRVHIDDNIKHITSDERTKWDAAATKVNTIDTELKADSNNLVANSAITKAIQDNEEAISASLNDLNKRKLDISAYAPVTSDERTKWNNASTSSHTHANKDVLDTITAIDTELKKDSNNLVVNSAITKVIQENEEAISSALNDLNKKIATMEQEINTLKTEITALKNKS